MAKSNHSKDLNDKQRSKIVAEEIKKFSALIKGHKRILEAIGSL